MSAKCVTFVERVSRIPPLHVYSVTLPFGGLVLPAGRRLWYMGMVVEQQRGLICGRRRGRVRGSTAHFQTTDSNFSLSVFAGKKTKKSFFFWNFDGDQPVEFQGSIGRVHDNKL